MTIETPSQKTQVCPTCGTRLSESATRCLVCGTELSAKAPEDQKKAEKKVEKSVQASRMPEITLGLPAALGREGRNRQEGDASQAEAHICDQAPRGRRRADRHSDATWACEPVYDADLHSRERRSDGVGSFEAVA